MAAGQNDSTDPIDAFMLLAAGQSEAAARGPVELATLQVQMASELLAAHRQGLSGVLKNAQFLLREALGPLSASLPGTRNVLVNAHYLLGDSARGDDWDMSRHHFDTALGLIDRDSDPIMWVALCEGLASALIRGSEGGDPAVQERSIRLYQDALSFEPPQVPPEHWAHTASNLLLTLKERHHGDPLQTWITILKLSRRALKYSEDAEQSWLRPALARHLADAYLVVGVWFLFMGQSEDQPLEMIDEAYSWYHALGVTAPSEARETLQRLPDDRSDVEAALWIQVLAAADQLLTIAGDRRGRVRILRQLAILDPDAANHYNDEAARLQSVHDDPDEVQMPTAGHDHVTPAEPVAGPPALTTPTNRESEQSSESVGLVLIIEAHKLLDENVPDTLACEELIQALSSWLEQAQSRNAGSQPTPTERLALGALGMLYTVRGVGSPAANSEQAIAHLSEAARLGRDSGKQSASVLHTLGVELKNRRAGSRAENIEQAIAALTEAMSLTDAQESPLAWATTASQLGTTFSDRVKGDRAENLEQALLWYQRALDQRPREVTPVRWAWSMHNLGATLIARQLGNRVENLHRARDCLHAALEVRTEQDLPEHYAITQSVLADCELSLADIPIEADGDHLTAAVTALENAGRVFTADNYRIRWLNNRLRLAVTLLKRVDQGASQNAEEDLDRATELAQQMLLAASTETEPELLALARQVRSRCLLHEPRSENALAQVEGELQQAAEYYARAQMQMQLLEVLALRASLQAEREQWDAAAALYADAVDIADDLGLDTISLTTLRAFLPSVATLRADAAYCYRRSALFTAADALVMLERGRSQVLSRMLETDGSELVALDRSGAEGSSAAEAFRAAAQRVRQLTAAEVQAGGLAGSAPSAELLDELRVAKNRRDEAIARIRSIPGFSDFQSPASIETIISQVQPGCPIMYAYAGELGGQVIALHMETGGPAILATDLDLTSLQVDWLLYGTGPGQDGIRGSVRRGPQPLEETLEVALPPLGYHFSVAIASLANSLHVQQATLVACGDLAALPIAAAPVKADFSRRLLDVTSISTAPSARVLNSTRKVRSTRKWFSPRTTEPSYLGVASSPPGTTSLPWADSEVASVAARRRKADLLTESTATVDAVLSASANRMVVHLACHGSFDPINLERSSLILDDGSVSLGRIVAGQSFQGTRLVIASACDSAGSDARLADEFTGLLTTFIQAGARYALGALWPVDDMAAALLASRVATACLDPAADPARELARAQSWLRDMHVDEAVTLLSELAHASQAVTPAAAERLEKRLDGIARIQLGERAYPFAAARYWAPFVVVGG